MVATTWAISKEYMPKDSTKQSVKYTHSKYIKSPEFILAFKLG